MRNWSRKAKPFAVECSIRFLTAGPIKTNVSQILSSL